MSGRLVLAKIEHAELARPVCVVQHEKAITYKGEEYSPFAFSMTEPMDGLSHFQINEYSLRMFLPFFPDNRHYQITITVLTQLRPDSPLFATIYYGSVYVDRTLYFPGLLPRLMIRLSDELTQNRHAVELSELVP